MNRLVRKLTSLTNLGRAKSVSGQMATLLILLMVIGLSFVLFTANIGNVSVQSTALANSADAAALQLSSQLSTKARQCFEGLGNKTRECYKTGYLSMVLAIVFAVVMIALTFGAGLYTTFTNLFTNIGQFAASNMSFLGLKGTAALMASGALGGAAGGALGGEMAGTGAGRGALLGAAIGAAIGGVAGAVNSTPLFGMNEVAFQGELASIYGSSVLVPSGFIAGFWTSIGMGAAISSTGYNEAHRQRGLDDYMSGVAAMFGKASEKDRLTQTTIMRAMAGVVDDPNMSADVNDCNYNNDTTDLVSDYQAWWWRRAEEIPKVSSVNIAAAMQNIETYLGFIAGLLGDETGWIFISPGLFVSKEYKWETDLSVPPEQLDVLLPGEDPEGLLARSFRALEDSGVDLSFWEPGPTADEYMAAFAGVPDDECEGAACDTPSPPGYDRFDMIVASLREVYVWGAALKEKSPEELAATWDAWIGFVYTPEEDPDVDPTFNPYASPPVSLYGILTLAIYEMERWMAEIEALYPTWPECQLNQYGEFVTAPCRTDFGSWWEDASLDTLPDYEYSQLKTWLGSWGPAILDYLRSGLKGMAGGYSYTDNEIVGGKNPAVYEWSDARGRHRVRVKLGNFNVPLIAKKKYGNWLKGKICFELWHYSDEWEFGSLGRDENYVEVSRYDQPSGQAAIGRWNPLNRSITKRAYYSYGLTWDEVSLRKKH